MSKAARARTQAPHAKIGKKAVAMRVKSAWIAHAESRKLLVAISKVSFNTKVQDRSGGKAKLSEATSPATAN